jgi:hypothetical protein
LIGKGGIGEPVTEHDRASADGGADYVRGMLAARGKDEKRLALGRDELLRCG